MQATGVYRALRDHDLRIPEEVKPPGKQSLLATGREQADSLCSAHADPLMFVKCR